MCEMEDREKVGVFNYKSGNSQGILIRELSMDPVIVMIMQTFPWKIECIYYFL